MWIDWKQFTGNACNDCEEENILCALLILDKCEWIFQRNRESTWNMARHRSNEKCLPSIEQIYTYTTVINVVNNRRAVIVCTEMLVHNLVSFRSAWQREGRKNFNYNFSIRKSGLSAHRNRWIETKLRWNVRRYRGREGGGENGEGRKMRITNNHLHLIQTGIHFLRIP